jgi:UPF0271 protein
MKILKILDSSYILHSNLDFSNESYCISNSVLREIKNSKANLMVNIAIKNGNIKIVDPSRETRKKVKAIAKETGDLEKLSHADIDVLALALENLEKNSILLTDDYGIQNVASLLKLNWQGLQQRGIKEKFHWIKICEGCKREYDKEEQSDNICKICGSALKRIPKPFQE